MAETPTDSSSPVCPRRRVLRWLGAGSLLVTGRLADVLAQGAAPAVVVSDNARPQLPYGLMSGDVSERHAMVWGRVDRPARMVVEVATTEAMRDARRLVGPAAQESSDFTARADLTDLAPGQTCFYRVQFESLADPRAFSVPLVGRFRTPSDRPRDVVFAFSGDEAGQGWGINEAFGGYRVYESMSRFDPDFFIHSGDQIYADGPIAAEVTLEDGTLWKNIVTPAKQQVAQTMDDFRGNFAYNLLDANKRRFCAEVPMLVQWDRPESARFTDFDPFWEFVGGPINAGTFGPGEVDKTFGPDVKFVSIPNGRKQNRSPKGWVAVLWHRSHRRALACRCTASTASSCSRSSCRRRPSVPFR